MSRGKILEYKYKGLYFIYIGTSHYIKMFFFSKNACPELEKSPFSAVSIILLSDIGCA